ncbi:MAG: 16S rRNA (cytidine(1402)-2'-O)-methyltransferase [Lachnospiraceae bacterium]|nr:16S rRNA (cytidine(1402)-2'-O)-methyltransferase [Lachnospiraceae bacterium]
MDTNEGILFLCATPIGNLSDISDHVLTTLREADLIAAEDTRNSIKLLNRFDIRTPMTSYHEHNKYDKANELIEKMRKGCNIALITDAGTPAISDPGEVLVRMCHEAGIKVTSLPGPCACITALTLSGMNARRFCFEGFLPSDKKERKEILSQLVEETRTTVLYEAPHHLKETLGQLAQALGDRELTICKELTKKHEKYMRTTLPGAVAYYEENEPRGEYVLVLAGKDPELKKEEAQQKWAQMPIEEHMRCYEEQGLDRKECMKRVAMDRGVSKRSVYQQLL